MAEDIVIIQPITPTVIISSPGPQGPAGAFTPGDVAYVHTQSVASSFWDITHNLGFRPTAVILDSAGTNCEGSFAYPDINTMTITFNSAFTGTAYLI